MSTIASPRPSFTLSSASRRGSASTDTTITSTSRAAERGSLRRNRTALRDYYNLQAAANASSPPPTPSLDAEQESELDQPGFDPETYVQHLLAYEGLEGVLRVESGLVSDIRSLDGEKKALVYDNYSKLIAATDTIRSMREKMDPVIPETGSLSDAVGHISATAQELRGQVSNTRGHEVGEDAERRGQRETARWVLGSPTRLRDLLDAGEEEAAQKDWQEVNALLEKWTGVKGVQDVRQACLDVLSDREAG